jgi:hypothetical protein
MSPGILACAGALLLEVSMVAGILAIGKDTPGISNGQNNEESDFDKLLQQND